MTPEQRNDALVQGLSAAPSLAAVLATKVLDLTIDNWLALAGIGFIALQALYLLWRWRRDWKRERQRRAAGLPPPETDRGDL